jgi:hypothetical protein
MDRPSWRWTSCGHNSQAAWKRRIMVSTVDQICDFIASTVLPTTKARRVGDHSRITTEIGRWTELACEIRLMPKRLVVLL